MSRVLPTRRGNTKYPWDKWTDGEIHIAVQGKDFTCSSRSFVTGVHVRAKLEGMQAETSTEELRTGDRVTFLFKKQENSND